MMNSKGSEQLLDIDDSYWAKSTYRNYIQQQTQKRDTVVARWLLGGGEPRPSHETQPSRNCFADDAMRSCTVGSMNITAEERPPPVHCAQGAFAQLCCDCCGAPCLVGVQHQE